MTVYVPAVGWVLGVFYFFLLYVFVRLIAIKKYKNEPILRSYLVKGFLVKLVGSFAFVVYHAYVYGGGDTFGYFVTGLDLNNVLFSAPSKYFEILFAGEDKMNMLRSTVEWTWPDAIMQYGSNLTVAKFSSFLSLFGLNYFVPTSLLFATLSFWGIWKLFVLLASIYKSQVKLAALAFLFFPTVVFWGSGISKDSLSIGFLCLFAYSALQIFLLNKVKLSSFILFMVSGFIVYSIKSYIIFSFLPPLLFAVLFGKVTHIKSKLTRIAVVPVIVSFFGVIVYFGFNFISAKFSEFALENLTDKILNTNSALQNAGSAFDIGIKPENISSVGDLISFFPKALIAALFRPWLWEAKNPAMLLSALESLFVTILFFLVFIKGYFFKTLRVLFSDPLLLSFFVYAILFLGLMGLSTSNFGTLVRYKLPAMPFLIFSLLMLNYKLNDSQKSQKINFIDRASLAV